MHGLVCGFGKGFGRGAIAVMHQVGSHHPDETRQKNKNTLSDWTQRPEKQAEQIRASFSNRTKFLRFVSQR